MGGIVYGEETWLFDTIGSTSGLACRFYPVSETISGQPVTEITGNAEKGNYIDGVYTGTGEGVRGRIQVQVTVEDGAENLRKGFR